MTTAAEDLPQWTTRYARVLRSSPTSAGTDRALSRARVLGKDALTAGLSVSQLVEAHAEAVLKCAGNPALPIRSDWTTRVLRESLTPFDAVHRGTGDIVAALGATRQRYGELVEHANDVIFAVGLDGRLSAVNRAGERLLGCRREEALGLLVDDLITSLKVKRSFQRSRRGRALRRRRHSELDIITVDGRTVPIEVNLAPTVDNGAVVGLQGIARDITHRRQVEFALRHLNQRLEERARRIAHALHDEAGQRRPHSGREWPPRSGRPASRHVSCGARLPRPVRLRAADRTQRIGCDCDLAHCAADRDASCVRPG
jgi:PAS domain S-box-containing protein